MAKFKLEDGTEVEAFTADEVKSMVETEVIGLKAKRDELLGLHSKDKERLTELEQAQKLAEDERQKEKGEFKSLYERTQSELEAERDNARKFRQTVQERDLELAAAKFDSLAVDDTSIRHLRADVKNYARHDGEKVVYEIDGVETSIDAVREKIIAENPRLVKGSQASGGDARGASKQAQGVEGNSINSDAEQAKKSGDVSGFLKAQLQTNLSR